MTGAWRCRGGGKGGRRRRQENGRGRAAVSGVLDVRSGEETNERDMSETRREWGIWDGGSIDR